MTDVWIVLEHCGLEMSNVLCVFDNAEAAQNYVDDPHNAGNLFVEQETIESDYDLQ